MISACSAGSAAPPPPGRRPPAARVDFHPRAVREVALVGARRRRDDLGELAAVVRSRLRPHLVLAGGAEGTERTRAAAERTAIDGRAAAYVCERFACRAPVTAPEALAAALDA